MSEHVWTEEEKAAYVAWVEKWLVVDDAYPSVDLDPIAKIHPSSASDDACRELGLILPIPGFGPIPRDVLDRRDAAIRAKRDRERAKEAWDSAEIAVMRETKAPPKRQCDFCGVGSGVRHTDACLDPRMIRIRREGKELDTLPAVDFEEVGRLPPELAHMAKPEYSTARLRVLPALFAAIENYRRDWPEERPNRMPISDYLRRCRLNEEPRKWRSECVDTSGED